MRTSSPRTTAAPLVPSTVTTAGWFSAEQVVTWDHPVVASEDLVFRQMAAHRGLDWGLFYAFVYLTYGVHGYDAASSEASLWIAHDLASGDTELAANAASSMEA
jgi:hypothetical protein